jgi:hypothetical protein
MISAETLARTTADGLKTQLFLIIRMQQQQKLQPEQMQ